MQILQAMGAMTPTCVPSPLNDATKRCVLPSLALSLDDIDPKSVHCLQLSFVDAVGVPRAFGVLRCACDCPLIPVTAIEGKL